MRLIMILEKISGPLVVMHSKFSRGRYDKYIRALLGCKGSAAQQFNGGHHIHESFCAASLRCTEDVTSVQNVSICACFDLGRLCEA